MLKTPPMPSSMDDLRNKWVTPGVGLYLVGIDCLSFKNSIRDITLPGTEGLNTMSGSGRRLIVSTFEIVEPGLHIMS